MTSLATAGRRLQKFEKTAENHMPSQTALSRILMVRRFAWPTQLVSFLFHFEEVFLFIYDCD